jgi:hypothetical protein
VDQALEKKKNHKYYLIQILPKILLVNFEPELKKKFESSPQEVNLNTILNIIPMLP